VLKSEIICAGLILLVWPAATGNAQEWVPVPPHRLPEGTVIEGFSRPAQKTGFAWSEGTEDGRGGWIPGSWVPSGPEPRGRTWVRGRFHRGEWISGYWVKDPENAAWVPGRYNRYGRWVEGAFLAD